MRVVRAAGWVLLGLLALAGLAVSGTALLATTRWGRPIVARAVIGIVDRALAGTFELGGLAVLPDGRLEITGLRVTDPDGHLVLAVDRARVAADVTRLRRGRLGLSVELDGPAVLMEEEEGGGLSIARAFAPSHPSPPGARRTSSGPGLTLELSSVTVRNGSFWWVSARGANRLEARDVTLDARGAVGADAADAALSLRGRLDLPLAAPLAIDVVVSRDADAVRLPILRVDVGGSALAAAGEADLFRRTGRLAVTRLDVTRGQARALVPRVGGGADLDATAYAESDGTVASAALRAMPRAGDEAPGRVDASAAARLDGSRALGFDVALDRLDPARLHALAPPGRVTLTARGAVAGRSLETLRGDLALSLAPSALRGGVAGPAEIVARAVGGAFQVDRLRARAPGLAVDGSGRFRPRGAVSGHATVDVADVRRAVRNLSALLGARPPSLSGRAHVEATLSGTARAPAVRAAVDAPSLRAGSLALAGVKVRADAAGPWRTPRGGVEGTVDVVRGGATAWAHGVALRGRLEREEAWASLTGSVPRLGREPVSVEGRGRLGPRRTSLLVSELTVRFPGKRYALEAPATIRFEGPRVDRLALAAGRERIVLEGGIGRRGALDARLTVADLDLSRLPAGVLPSGTGAAGVLSAEARAAGTVRRPALDARFALAGGAFRALRAVDAQGTLAWDGAARRARLAVSARRAEGGLVDVAADLPVPLTARPSAPISLRVRGEALPLASIAVSAGSTAPVDGAVAIDAALEGTAGDPALRGTVRVEQGAYDNLLPLGITLSVEDVRDELRVKAQGALDGDPAASLDAAVPLDVGDLLARPAETLAALRRARVRGDVVLPGVDLGRLAGVFGLPQDLAGRLQGRASVDGSASAPRGTIALAVTGATVRGVRDLAGQLDAALEATRITVRARLSAAGQEVLQVDGSLGAPLERLTGPGGRERLARAPLAVDAAVPRADLTRAAVSGEPLSGQVDARLEIRGTPGVPVARLEVAGSGLAVRGKPLGELVAHVRYADARTEAAATLRGATGGSVELNGTLSRRFGVDADAPPLARAPLDARLVAHALDLGIAPAFAPGVVRLAGGTLEADVTARGPLSRPSPRGVLAIQGGRLAISELGEWTDIALDASVDENAIELRNVSARRGPGRLVASGSVRGLAARAARVEAHARLDGFSIARAGQELARVDLRADATGTYGADALTMEIRVPSGTVRLPGRSPRELQPVDTSRPDIVVGRFPERKGSRVAAPAGPPEKPFRVAVHLVAPGPFSVKSDNPLVNIDLKADLTYERAGATESMTGSVIAVRGLVEPIAGRMFQIERARVQFTGGPPKTAVLDVEARYDNPTATVTVVVGGPVTKPEIRLTSNPPMDESQIALLIATGRATTQQGGAGVDASSGAMFTGSSTTGTSGAGGTGEDTGKADAGKAALGVIASQAFKNLVANKLPIDTVAVDASAVRAGKYVTDKIYVGYVRRFDARVERGENENEVRVEYQITPRWTLESRYGTSQSGSASVIWSKDY